MTNKGVEEVLQKLEIITKELSEREVSVDEGLKKFKEGVELIKIARKQLEKAENEFKEMAAELEEENG